MHVYCVEKSLEWVSFKYKNFKMRPKLLRERENLSRKYFCRGPPGSKRKQMTTGEPLAINKECTGQREKRQRNLSTSNIPVFYQDMRI